MPRTASKTDREALRLARGLAVLAIAWGAIRWIVRSHSAGRFVLAGLLVLLLARLAPGVLVPVMRPVQRALVLFGELVSTVALTVLYLVLVWPWRGVLRLAGAIAPAEEAWPPTDTSGWVPVEAGSDGFTRRARPGSILAMVAVHLGGAAALLKFLGERPSAFVVPVLVILLLLAALVLAGHTTGLGPLIYTLF